MVGSVAGDAGFFGDPVAATVALSKARAAQGKPGAYVYHFKRDIPGDDHPGAFHSSEIWYVFGTLHRSDRPFTGLDYDLSLRMTNWWTNFARTGDPGDGFSAYTADNPRIMEIGEETGMAGEKNNDMPEG
jgi:carboxylesterase type B